MSTTIVNTLYDSYMNCYAIYSTQRNCPSMYGTARFFFPYIPHTRLPSKIHKACRIFLAYIRSTRDVKSYMVTGNTFCQYNPAAGPGFKYIIAKITRLGIHFGYKILDGQTIFIFKYNTNTR